jgi:hypothetical protein
MGKINQGILGGLSGKLGPVVGGSWKGINYLRSKPTSVSNPNTTAQQNQRTKFSAAVSAAQALLGNIIQVLWNPIAQGMSGYNRFMSVNIENFDNTGVLNYGAFRTTIGPLLESGATALVVDASTNQVKMLFTNNAGTGNALAGDECNIVAYNASQDYWLSNRGANVRSDGEAELSDSAMQVGDVMHVWVSFTRAGNTSLSSVPMYLTGVVVP